MNRSSRSPVVRPLSNISNRKPIITENIKKQTDQYTKPLAKQAVIFPQTFEIPKSSIPEPKQSEISQVHPKSSITSFQTEKKDSCCTDTSSRKSSIIRKRSSIHQEESKFFFFKIIVFLGLIASGLMVYELQTYFFEESNTSLGALGDVQTAKEKMIANSISNSIIYQVVTEHKLVEIRKEKEDVKKFYAEDFTSSLWKLVQNNVNSDFRIRVEKINDNDFWTM